MSLEGQFGLNYQVLENLKKKEEEEEEEGEEEKKSW